MALVDRTRRIVFEPPEVVEVEVTTEPELSCIGGTATGRSRSTGSPGSKQEE